MLVILLAVFAVLVQNGESNCMIEFQDDKQVCLKNLEDSSHKAADANSDDDRKRILCCALDAFKECIMKAGKKCGDMAEQFTKQTFEMAKAMVKTPCDDYTCSGGNTLVPVNAIAVYLLLYLGYFFYMNKF